MAQSQLVHSFREFAYMFERWCAKNSIPGTEAVKQQTGARISYGGNWESRKI